LTDKNKSIAINVHLGMDVFKTHHLSLTGDKSSFQGPDHTVNRANLDINFSGRFYIVPDGGLSVMFVTTFEAF